MTMASSRRQSQASVAEVHEALQDIDPATKFLYTPHTLTGLTLLIGALVYYSGALDPHTAYSLDHNIKSGLLAAVGVFLCELWSSFRIAHLCKAYLSLAHRSQLFSTTFHIQENACQFLRRTQSQPDSNLQILCVKQFLLEGRSSC